MSGNSKPGMISQGRAHFVRESGFERFVAVASKIPMLDAEEERRLTRQWTERRDRRAFDRLITSHLRLAAKIARGYRGYGVAIGDLTSAASMGLVKAAYGFDASRGVRFGSYAAVWIRAEINRHVMENWSLVRISQQRANKRLFFGLRRVKSELGIGGDAELEPTARKTVALHLDVPEKSVAEMNQRLSGGDVSLNVPASDADEEWQDLLQDACPTPEAILADKEEGARRSKSLHSAIGRLDERERSVVAQRWLGDGQATLAAIAVQFGVSHERIRQVEKRSLEKLRAELKATA